MVRYLLFFAVTAFVAVSCAPTRPTPQKFLPDLAIEQKLSSEQAAENRQIRDDYLKNVKAISNVAKMDLAERKQLASKKSSITKEEEALTSAILDAIKDDQVKELLNDAQIASLVDSAKTADELVQMLREKTNLDENAIQKLAKYKELQIKIAGAKNAEDLKKILEENTSLSADQISGLVAKKQALVKKQEELKFDALAKIHDRLLRNKKLGIGNAFCAKTSSLDEFIFTPVIYDFDSYTIDKASAQRLFNEALAIVDEAKKYKDMMLQIEGNCDERGSNAYNKALGDKRWTSAVPYLTSQAFDEKDVHGVSRGEECQTERDSKDQETWWRENRRDDFVWVLR